LRIGWVATRDAALLGRVAALKDYTTMCVFYCLCMFCCDLCKEPITITTLHNTH
jgi:aspartate/methionine/tyrosine aminotransferase